MNNNILALLIASVFGAALGPLLQSFNNDILAPVLSLCGSGNVKHRFFCLRKGPNAPYATLEDCKSDKDAIYVNYGNTVAYLTSFLLLCVLLYLSLILAKRRLC